MVEGTEPKITVYQVTLETEGAMWEESCTSKEILETFLKGIKAALSFTGITFSITPPIPGIDQTLFLSK